MASRLLRQGQAGHTSPKHWLPHTLQVCLISAGNSIGSKLHILYMSRMYSAAQRHIQPTIKELSRLLLVCILFETRHEWRQLRFGLGKVRLAVHSVV